MAVQRPLGPRVTIDDIAAIDDPAERARAAAAYIAAATHTITRAQTIRDTAVAEMLTGGWSVRKAATEVGLSPARVQQIKTASNGSAVPSPGGKD